MTAEQAACLEQFFKAHFSELQVHAFRFLGDWNRAEEAVINAFEIAAEKIDVFLNSENQIGWMKHTVKNVCRNFFHSQSRDTALLLAWEDLTESQIPSAEDPHPSELVEQCRTLLSEEDFRMVYESVVLEIPAGELAQKYGLTEWAIRKRIQRRLAKLRKFFEKNDF